ncbi:deoxyribodipyrimidine photo-lyase, partial [Klebsiella pneumoniae]|nr:deoxyribodipyrimidine photo-lyase [Klebsiella pneumoniae]
PAALDGGAGAPWLHELIWREGYRPRRLDYPKLWKGRPGTAWTDQVAGRAAAAARQAGASAEPGAPIGDAARRQRNAPGW